MRVFVYANKLNGKIDIKFFKVKIKLTEIISIFCIQFNNFYKFLYIIFCAYYISIYYYAYVLQNVGHIYTFKISILNVYIISKFSNMQSIIDTRIQFMRQD